MKFDCYILFKSETGELVPPLDTSGDPKGMIYDRLFDAEESAAWHKQAYKIDCDIKRCTIEVHD